MSDELQKCPFCGEQPDADDATLNYVECPSCGVRGPTPLRQGTARAIAAWNTRTPIASTDAEDAARYRYLRDAADFCQWSKFGFSGSVEELDAAIDAAMGESPGA